MGVLSSIFGTKNSFDPQDPNHVAQQQALAPHNSFQAKPADLPTQDYGSNIAQTMGHAEQNYGQEQSFIDSVRARANGTGGPSVAEEMLKRSTDANNANTASQIASDRSLSPALQARLISQGQAANQQGAAGQAATLRAQETTQAQSLLGAALGQQGQQNLGVLGTVAGAEQGQNALALQNSLGTQGINAGVAQQNAGLQLGQEQLAAGVGAGNSATNAGITGGVLNGAGGVAAMLSDERVKTDVKRLSTEALPGVPEAKFRYKGEPNGSIHRGVIAQDVEKKFPHLVGRTKDGIRTVPATLMKYADGGKVPPLYAYLDSLHGGPQAMAEGGDVATTPDGSGASGAGGAGGGNPLSGAGKAIAGAGKSGLDAYRSMMSQHLTGSMYAHGGKVPAVLSPGERVVSPQTAKSPAAAARAVATGSAPKVPGQAKVAGDSPKNDTVHTQLEPGSVVVPRSVVNAKNPAKATASFVASVLRRSGGGKKYAAGGKVGPAMFDPRKGGMVHKPNGDGDDKGVEPAGRVGTARGVGGGETRRRIKSAGKGANAAPKYAEAD